MISIELRPDDQIILKKELQDNWWKAELNGEKIRIRITAVEPSRGLKKRMSGMRGIVGNMMDLSRVSHFLWIMQSDLSLQFEICFVPALLSGLQICPFFHFFRWWESESLEAISKYQNQKLKSLMGIRNPTHHPFHLLHHSLPTKYQCHVLPFQLLTRHQYLHLSI